MSRDGRPFQPRPGRIGDRGKAAGRRSQSLAAQVRRAAARAGYTARRPGPRRGTGSRGRGRVARLQINRPANSRRVVVKARVVRHRGARFRAAPLARHIAYLGREGVTRDGTEAGLFNATSNEVDHDAFAQRCEDDRHHFRFIVSPEDAGEMSDLRAFTRELMTDLERDLETSLDWVAIDHWNTDNPHIHILVRGRADDGSDLVIDGSYIAQGIRGRAEERVTLELGLRSEHEMQLSRQREVEADRWTGLDRKLVSMIDPDHGQVVLRPDPGGGDEEQQLLIGRASKLARLGLAQQQEPGVWTISGDAERVLRDLADRGDIIRTMHRAMSTGGDMLETGRFALHGEEPGQRIIGRLVERGLHDELAGSAYAIVDGTDGQIHHLRFRDLEQTGDAHAGAIVELRSWQDRTGQNRSALAVRSDLTLDQQVSAGGATWLDRELVTRETVATCRGFGAEVRAAMDRRTDRLEAMGLARRHGNGVTFERDLVGKLRDRELASQIAAIGERTGMAHTPSGEGENVSGIYRRRLTLSSGRFALVETVRDDGALGFQLVPWRPALEHKLGQQVSGVMRSGGQIEWSLGRGRGLGV
jgi:type IV secretory pathway VirD2 relaxase